MKSWKTTLGGILGGLGVLGRACPDPTVHKISVALESIGLILLGGAARDNKVTSEEAGAK